MKKRATLGAVDLPTVAFVLACIALLFGGGYVVGRYKVFPYSALEFATQSFKNLWAEKWNLLGVRPTEYLYPAQSDGAGVTRYTRQQAAPGLTMLAGFFEQNTEVRLIRLDGSVVNRWPVAFKSIFPDPTHIRAEDRPKTNWNAAIHGAMLLPDGSLVANFTYLGLAKLDRCGKVLWTLPRMTHHSVSRASSGGFWVPGARRVEKDSRFPVLRTPYIEDTILHVADDGRVLQEISVLDILFKNNLLGLLNGFEITGDLTHLNDVDELDGDTAAAFPRFESGDLLLSMRFQNMIMVVSPETLLVKWRMSGPWLGQHDPDFLRNGRISVYNNNDDRTDNGSRYGGSNIMEVDPGSGAVAVTYGTSPGQHFFTRERGKLQRIGAGEEHMLLTVPGEGRVIETDSSGQTVWEYINRYDKDSVALITEATRYTENYFEVRDWSCVGR